MNVSADNQIPKQARVVIIGGGIMGCGVAYHLAHEGCSDVVLLEKAELTSGSTWHAAGQITYSTSSYTLAQCIKYNLGLYSGALEQETGQSVTWHGCGSLRMAYTDEDVDWARQCASVIRSFDLPIELLDVEAARKIHPFYNYDGVKAVSYTPLDGHADPAGIALALAAGARAQGAKLIRRCRVIGVTAADNGEWIVHTERGDIRCEHVVNAGGCYAKQIGEWNDISVPTTSVTHHYFVTETVEEFKDLPRELPVVRDDSQVSGYLRMEQKSGLIGLYEKSNINTVWERECPWEAENELFEPDYDRILPWLEGAFARFPVLGNYGIKRVVHGAISHPPDGNPLVGPAGGVRNYWLCCGTQIAIGWGPGLTRELARWILYGAADISMREYDPRRFGGYATTDWLVTKGKEDYSLRHELPYPHRDRPLGRPIKTSAIHQQLASAGAVFEEVYGWERPEWFARGAMQPVHQYGFGRTAVFDMVAREVAAVRAHVGINDLSAFAKVMVSGAGAEAFLDSMVANRMPRRDGGIVLAHMLNRRGRFEVEVTITRLDKQRFYIGASAYLEQRLIDHLMQHCQRDDVVVENLSDSWGALAVSGPDSRKVLAALTEQSLENADFKWLSAREITLGGEKVLALRVSYVGELGWEIHAPSPAIAAVYTAVMAAGQPYGIDHYGSLAMNSMRMEKAFHGIGELTNEATLPEAGLWRFARFDKGDFLGREATRASMDSRDLPWICVYLEMESDGKFDGNGGEAVLHNGEVVGSINSIAYGHTTGKVHAFAYVSPLAGVVDNTLEVIINDSARSARVRGAPAYDPEHMRCRS